MQERCMLQLYFKESLGSVAKCVLQKSCEVLQSVFVVEGCEVAIKSPANCLRSVAKCASCKKVVKLQSVLQSVFCN